MSAHRYQLGVRVNPKGTSAREAGHLTVWVLMISHRHGHNTYVCRTEKRAWSELVKYVDENWKQEMGDKRKPTLDSTAIEQYFENVDEWYDLDQNEVLK